MKNSILKISVFAFLILGSTACGSGDSENTDKTPVSSAFLDKQAETYLDEMVSALTSMSAYSFTINAAEKNENDSIFGPTKQSDIYKRNTNRFYIYSVSAIGENAYWYDGKTLSYFSFDKNTYDSISAPATIVETIEMVNRTYGVEFPAADFFYPTLTDDLIAFSDSVLYVGDTIVNENELAVVNAKGELYNIYIFLNKETKLPAGLYVNDKNKASVYKAIISNWVVDPKLPDLMFEFSAPSGSTREIIKKK